MKRLFLMIVTTFLLFSCDSFRKKEMKDEKISSEMGNNQEKMEEVKGNPTENTSEASFSEQNPYFFSKEELPIAIDIISKQEFLSAQKKVVPNTEKLRKIVDFKEVASLLKGVVEFNTDKEEGNFGAIKKVHFRNGAKDEHLDKLQEYWFTAYFPDEDILLCEGGHSSEMLLNLTNGKEEDAIGNPDYVINSPAKTIRLNGYYNGQSNVHFIEKKKDDKYLKIINVEEIFYAYNKSAYEYFKEAFWADEKTLYLSFENYSDDGDNEFIYNKVTIKENTIAAVDIPKNFPVKNFPVEETTNDPNTHYPLLDKALATRLFSGLFPDAVKIYACYSLAYSDDFYSIVVAVEKPAWQKFTSSFLFTVSKQYEIIDYLPLWYRTTDTDNDLAQLSKNEIIKKQTVYCNNEPAAEYIHYKIDEKGNILLTKRVLDKKCF